MSSQYYPQGCWIEQGAGSSVPGSTGPARRGRPHPLTAPKAPQPSPPCHTHIPQLWRSQICDRTEHLKAHSRKPEGLIRLHAPIPCWGKSNKFFKWQLLTSRNTLWLLASQSREEREGAVWSSADLDFRQDTALPPLPCSLIFSLGRGRHPRHPIQLMVETQHVVSHGPDLT